MPSYRWKINFILNTAQIHKREVADPMDGFHLGADTPLTAGCKDGKTPSEINLLIRRDRRIHLAHTFAHNLVTGQ